MLEVVQKNEAGVTTWGDSKFLELNCCAAAEGPPLANMLGEDISQGLQH